MTIDKIIKFCLLQNSQELFQRTNNKKCQKRLIILDVLGLALLNSVGVKLKLMFIGECATVPYFEKVRRCARATNSNKREVGAEAAQLTGAQVKIEAHLGASPVAFVACYRRLLPHL